MAATYKQFLAAPNSGLLSSNAALHYVTTTKTFAGPTEIIKHLNLVQKQITKKKEDVLNVVDGGRTIVFEVDTGLGFQTGGGAYLPGLDDNFLSGRVAYISITHFVTFDEAGKISQIRLQWDQGSLLKQVEIIGKSGRNWPIIDSREQLSFLLAALKSNGTAVEAAPDHNEVIIRTRGNSQNALRDPHASLQLFGPREDLEGPSAAVVSPYAGTRPQQRTFTEILGDEPEPGSPSANRAQHTMSPSKGGQGKNFQPMRIFDGHKEVPEADIPKEKRYIRPNPTKFTHFDFADGSDPQDAPAPGYSIEDRPKTKHSSQWDFSDFVTPQKVKPGKSMGLRSQDVRHWDTDKDSGVSETPIHQQPVKPRRDAETHFELQDDGEPVPHADRPGAKPRGYTHNEGLGLYKNQLFDKEDPAAPTDRALGNITNLKGRNNDFDPHFTITDHSPGQPKQPHQVPEAHKKSVSMMNSNWSYDPSPAQKENNPLEAGREPDAKIHIAGDGMGGRKGTNRDWLYGETEPQDLPKNVPGRKQQGVVSASGLDQPKEQRINIAGDGMGGRKGTDRDWLYGETEHQEQPKNIPGRKQGPSAQPTEPTQPKKQGINIAGDGMGGRKGTNRDWLYGETEAQEQPKSIPGRKPGSNVQNNEPEEQRINIAGDGMGGRKGTNRDWLYGDEAAAAPPPPAAPASRKQGTTTAKKDFWDF